MKINYLRLTAHLKIKSTSPILFQIQFQNQIPWVKLLRAVGRGRFYWRCNHLDHWGNEAGQWRFCRAKFKIILRSETEKRFWQGLSLWKSQPNLSLSYEKTKPEADFDMGFLVPHVGIIVNILSATSNLNVITSLSEEATLIFYSERRLTSSAKAECEVVSSWW